MQSSIGGKFEIGQAVPFVAVISRHVDADESQAGLTLEAHNDIWAHIDESKHPLPSYVEVLGLNYGAGVKLVDFDEAETARATINQEVSRLTHDTVEELIPGGVIVPHHTTMVLTNTIYLKAAWAVPFEAQLTRKAAFTDLTGDEREVNRMQKVDSIEYAAMNGFAAVRLPYVGGQVTLTLILPDAGEFDDVEAALDPDTLTMLSSSFETKMVGLELPKFELRSDFALKSLLEALGMRLAFDEADFSGIGPHQVYIQEVLHEAFVSLDESGTEAGAATAVVFGDESAGPQPEVEFIVDRPFILLLQDVPSSTLLFVGRVLKPE